MTVSDAQLPSGLRQIADGYHVAGQIRPDQVAALARAGFKTVICNRPDGEAPDQPGAMAVKAECDRLGLVFFHIPVVHAGITHENVDATRKALDGAPAPVFAYCRSGGRSTNLYGIAAR